MTTASVFHPPSLLQAIRARVASEPRAGEARDKILAAAAPWQAMSYDQLWSLPFGATLPRSWMVWSNGYCPACMVNVPMYTWKIAALTEPWKLRCPHCAAAFPTNDFGAYYRSGLNPQGVFDATLADRSLLFNAAHPDPADPRHRWGVDDGHGFIQGDHKWLFIATYLIYGQWKQLVVAGVQRCAAAFTVTGDQDWARRAAILLDRIADLHPDFDFGSQAILYEKKADRGYVSTWHDACMELRELVLAYDLIRPTLASDGPLKTFLAAQAKRYQLPWAKGTGTALRQQIETRILADVLANRHKVATNYPGDAVLVILIKQILDPVAHDTEVRSLIDEMVATATAVDGTTGEKGLTGYTCYVLHVLGHFLETFARVDEGFLPALLARHPKLAQTYRFHLDTWYQWRHYPRVGDCGNYGDQVTRYLGLTCSRAYSLQPSSFSLLWRLAQVTGDPAYAQIMWHENGNSVKGLPHDLAASDAPGLQRGVRRLIRQHGAEPKLVSRDYPAWHLALLRSGQGRHERLAWMDYDTGGKHAHQDALNLGFFWRGLDLLPDLGYPPVQFGGWNSPRSLWYYQSAAHNSVVVDGQPQPRPWNEPVPGETTLWAQAPGVQVMRASVPAANQGRRFERTVLLLDLDEHDCVLLEVLRVAGGREHAKFLHSGYGDLRTTGLRRRPAPDYGHQSLMRHFRLDPAAQPGWSADWDLRDRHGVLPPGSEPHLRYFDLTDGAAAGTCQGWISTGSYNDGGETWIPRLMIRRRAAEGAAGELVSTFIGVLAPYEGRCPVSAVTRLALVARAGAATDSAVAVELTLRDGTRHLLVLADPACPGPLRQPDWDLRSSAQVTHQRRSASGEMLGAPVLLG